LFSATQSFKASGLHGVVSWRFTVELVWFAEGEKSFSMRLNNQVELSRDCSTTV
jgi:hypothetical protein